MRGVIITTGIGRSEKVDQPEKLASRIGLPFRIFDWQKFVEPESDELAKIHTSYGSTTSKKVKTLAYDYIYDETSYAEKKDEILADLKRVIDESGFTDVVLIGHSWGAVIMYDYAMILDPRVENLITMGNPLPWKYGYDFAAPFMINWYNFWEKNDWVAHKMMKGGCADIEFKSKSWIRGWNVAAHTSYLVSHSLPKIIKRILG